MYFHVSRTDTNEKREITKFETYWIPLKTMMLVMLDKNNFNKIIRYFWDYDFTPKLLS